MVYERWNKFSVKLFMKKTVFLFFCIFVGFLPFSVFAAESSYEGIVKRNAFDLTSEKKVPILPPASTILLPTVYLTGIARKDKIYTAYMVIKDKAQNKFLGLNTGETKYGVEVLKIMKDTVFISHSGNLQELTFRQNSFPSVITKTPSKQNTKDKREERGERGRSTNSPQKAIKTPSRVLEAQVVTVPSRRPKIDPRLIEKGLEYLSRTEDSEKKEYIMKRLESLQSGQSRIKSNIDTNERRRQNPPQSG